MPRRQKYVRMTRDYAEFFIESLTMLNKATEEQVQAFCGRSKQESLQNMIEGFKRTINEKTEEVKPAPDAACSTCKRPYLLCKCDTGEK